MIGVAIGISNTMYGIMIDIRTHDKIDKTYLLMPLCWSLDPSSYSCMYYICPADTMLYVGVGTVGIYL